MKKEKEIDDRRSRYAIPTSSDFEYRISDIAYQSAFPPLALGVRCWAEGRVWGMRYGVWGMGYEVWGMRFGV